MSPHCHIIVSGRAMRLADTQPGERGAVMNCSLLVLSMMIIINFPTFISREWGPESCSVAKPPLLAVKEPTIITYHRQSWGPRLNIDENEKQSFRFVLFLVCGCVCKCLYALCFPFLLLPRLSLSVTLKHTFFLVSWVHRDHNLSLI